MAKASAAVARPRQACTDTLVQVFASMRPDLLRTLLRLLGRTEDAQDALQEAFLKCWRHREEVSQVRNLRAWVYRVCLNTARDFQRNVWRRRVHSIPSNLELDDVASPSPGEAALHQEALDRVAEALTRLRPEEQAVFLLRQNSALTYEQIAALRRLPVGTVKTQMRSALAHLRLALRDKAAACS
jgi:RNA polymerase sigma-70 factor (ECF subfamily)